MKRLALFSLTLFGMVALSSCGGSGNGELIGVQGREAYFPGEPYGMVFIPQGNFQAGQSDQDVMFSLNAPTKTVSVGAFYMDETEITNNEYRQFVQYVADSIAHTKLNHIKEGPAGEKFIDWEQEIKWNDEALKDMYYAGDDQVFGKQELDVRKLTFLYQWYDLNNAAHNKDLSAKRNKFIVRDSVYVYPDTLCWTRDFAYSYNEPMTQNYYSHPAYDDYPVVGVNWNQANAFCSWRTEYVNTFRRANKEVEAPPYHLPTEWQFEYAARGGLNTSPYPWGGPYIRNDKGCFLANFKPGRGNYTDDGGHYTVKVYSYNPNDFGLYNMSGNVAEWTQTSYEESVYSTVHDMNPDFRYQKKKGDDIVRTRKVIRGGSWKDTGHLLRVSTRDFEYQDTSKSYIGFRCIQDFLGRSMEDF
jgi:gliding motility-associated lipoprotein GldK